MPISIEITDAIYKDDDEDSNIKLEANISNDSNDKMGNNYLAHAREGVGTSVKSKGNIFYKFFLVGVTILTNTIKAKRNERKFIMV